ncbi:LysR family transcriptional regulator, partial [Roseibium sp.]|uniref:LysR family transcriptional regulator n=1 Tax=Roseibium sp. TaxID=1936156 RepID=UPI003297007A
LNLLLVFDAVYRESSISGAARKLNLSQPAVSNALARLRHFTDDQLFYRSGNAMLPTRAANALAVPVSHALSAVEIGFSMLKDFDPKTSERTFRLGINDFMRLMLIPALANVAEREAPNVTLDFQREMKSPPDMIEAIKRGEIDLTLLPARARGNDAEISTEVLYDDQLILVARAGHPAAGKELDESDLAKLKFVTTANSPALRNMVEDALSKYGIERKVACIMPDTITIPAVVEMTDNVAVMGYHFFLRHQREYALTQLHPPFDLPGVQGTLFWSKSMDDDAGHRWLREQATQIMKAALSVNLPEGA